MSGSILTLNTGSSSLKFALFNDIAELTETVRGEIETLGDGSHFHAFDINGKLLAEQSWPVDAKASATLGT